MEPGQSKAGSSQRSRNMERVARASPAARESRSRLHGSDHRRRSDKSFASGDVAAHESQPLRSGQLRSLPHAALKLVMPRPLSPTGNAKSLQKECGAAAHGSDVAQRPDKSLPAESGGRVPAWQEVPVLDDLVGGDQKVVSRARKAKYGTVVPSGQGHPRILAPSPEGLDGRDEADLGHRMIPGRTFGSAVTTTLGL